MPRCRKMRKMEIIDPRGEDRYGISKARWILELIKTINPANCVIKTTRRQRIN